MTRNKSANELLNDLLNITTSLPEGGFEVGNMRASVNGETSLDSIPRIYNINSPYSTEILPDGQKLLNAMAKLFCDDIRSDQNFKNFNARIGNKEWKDLFKQSFADVLIDLKLEKKKSAKVDQFNNNKEFYRKLIQLIKNKISIDQNSLQFVFGCHLSNKDLHPIVIGPVRFETINDWLDRIKGMENNSLNTTDIKSNWQELDKKQDSIEKLDTDLKYLYETIGGAKYVCTVDIKRSTFYSTGRYVALMAARIALTTIALGFQTPSKNLKHMYLNWDEKSTKQQLFVISKTTNGNELIHPPLPGGIKHLPLKNWEILSEDMASVFAAAGHCITWFVEGANDQQTNNSDKIGNFFHALLWFYQGCREEDVHFSIHHFMASLDSLSGSGKEKGIKSLMIDAGFENKSAGEISKLYSAVRSQLSHGSYKAISLVPNDNRNLAEFAASVCLRYILSQDITLIGD